MNVVPMGNALLMVSAGDRAKGAIVRLGLEEDGATDGTTIVEWAVELLPLTVNSITPWKRLASV